MRCMKWKTYHIALYKNWVILNNRSGDSRLFLKVYIHLISYDCFTYQETKKVCFWMFLLKNNRVQKFPKFVILSNSRRCIRNLSRPESIEMSQKEKTRPKQNPTKCLWISSFFSWRLPVCNFTKIWNHPKDFAMNFKTWSFLQLPNQERFFGEPNLITGDNNKNNIFPPASFAVRQPKIR